jgi:hypothetical protein
MGWFSPVLLVQPIPEKRSVRSLIYHLHFFRRRNQRSRDEQQQIYDDKDRETFGDDFVADHQKHENPLMMPGTAISKLLVFGDFNRTHIALHTCAIVRN